MSHKKTVDYDFCRSAKLTPKDLLFWLDLDDLLDKDLDELYSWNFFGRNMMIVNSLIRVSCVHKDFDRWANSEELTFEIERPAERRLFVDWIIEQREKPK
jgi:hypothetical protein